MLGWGQTCHAAGAIYYADCSDAGKTHTGTLQSPFSALSQVNALQLLPGDRLLFKRGTSCDGALKPKGSGREGAVIRLGAYGEGPLPRIVAGHADEAVLRLANQEYIEVEQLDLSGSSTYGIDVESGGGDVHHLTFRDLQVHGVRGKMTHKESGLVVIRSTGGGGTFSEIVLDGVHAYDTTQWSGIFLADAVDVQIRHAVVHDVQGDGIVVFSSRNAAVSDSVAWHTGMQHAQTIGTPNGIWTWHCMDCTVEGNEVFLSDSPGVDGGSFDIDFGNVRNKVLHNFGHDTAGYCVSVFGAFGPTVQSVVADNVCLHNGMSARLAQRQGAILLMTWQGGSLDGVEIRGNRVDWDPPGEAPIVQSGAALHAERVQLTGNEFWSTGTAFVDPELNYTGVGNSYFVASSKDIPAASARLLQTHHEEARVERGRFPEAVSHGEAAGGQETWKLLARLDTDDVAEKDMRSLLVEIESAALQFAHRGLSVEVECSSAVCGLAKDWSLPQRGVLLRSADAAGRKGVELKLVAPTGTVKRSWSRTPGRAGVGIGTAQRAGGA